MLTPPCLIDTVIWFQIWVSYLLCSYECTTVVIEARPSGAGAEDSEHSVVGSLGSGEDSDDSEVDSQGSGGDLEQQVGSPWAPAALDRARPPAAQGLHLHPVRRPHRRPRPPLHPSFDHFVFLDLPPHTRLPPSACYSCVQTAALSVHCTVPLFRLPP